MSRPDVSEERRPQIVDAAIQVFIRKGYRNATMPDVAREAGLSVGGVYWYFNSKDEIVAAILERLFEKDFGAFSAFLQAETPAAERLHALADGYAQSFQEWAWLNAIGIEFYGEATYNDKVGSVIRRYLQRYRTALVTLIEHGIQRGEFRRVDPTDAANALLGMEEGLALLLVADPDGIRWQESFKIGVELMIAGLRTPEQL
jgi:AcrR family transcriptional regulator